MMKRLIKQSYGLALCAAITTFSLSACSNDETTAGTNKTDENGMHTTQMVFQASHPSFDIIQGTRATDADKTWANGSKVYLQLSSGGKLVRGEATYDQGTDSWTLNYTGDLQTGAGKSEAYYMENAKATNSGLEFTDSTIVYQDLSSQFSFDGSRLIVAATLSPKTGRIRFKGSMGQQIFVKGMTRFNGYNAGRNTFSTTELPVMLTVTKTEADGSAYTPYIYGNFSDSNTRELIIADASNAFRQTFPSTVLKVGESGYVDIPTEASLNGWQSNSPFAGLAIADSIGENRAKIITDFIDNMVKVSSRQFNFSANESYPVIVSPFFMAKYEVTQKLYRAVMNRDFVGQSRYIGDDFPIYLYGTQEVDENYVTQSFTLPSTGYTTYISRVMREFVAKLNMLTNLHFDYPTEAEWEYAARGGQNMTGYFRFAGVTGNDYYGQVCSSSSDSYGVFNVGSKKPNELDIYDMTGNVNEVCYYIGNNLNSGSLTLNPQCYEGNYSFRGGSSYEVWANENTYAIISNRTSHYNGNPAFYYYGLRLIVRYLDF